MAQRLKRSTCPKWIFSQKTTNKISMYLLAPFILQNLKKILRADPELWGCAIFRPKMTHSSWTIFFGTNHYYYFHLPIVSFHCAQFQKILTGDREVLDSKWCICLPPPPPPKKNFFWKIINNIILIKFFQRIQSYEHAQFLGPKWPISSNEIFSENLLMSLVSFIHAYLHAKNQSQTLIY